MARLISRSEINKLVAPILRAGIPRRELIVNNKIEDNLTVDLPLKFSIRRSDFYFEIHNSFFGKYAAIYFPSASNARSGQKFFTDFSVIVNEMSEWAKRVMRELNEPDPWSVLGQGVLPEPELIDKQEGNQRFNDRELRTIKETVQKIRRFLVTEMDPDGEHLRAIDERLSFLEEETKKQNKKQWIYVAIGVVVTIADGLAMSPDQTHKLFEMLSGLFKNLFLKLLT